MGLSCLSFPLDEPAVPLPLPLLLLVAVLVLMLAWQPAWADEVGAAEAGAAAEGGATAGGAAAEAGDSREPDAASAADAEPGRTADGAGEADAASAPGGEAERAAETAPGLRPSLAMETELRRLRERIDDYSERVVELQREVAELRGDVQEPELPIRVLELELSASFYSGNLSDATLRSTATFTLEEPELYQLRLGGEYEFRTSQDVTLQQRLDGFTQFTLLPIDPISPFALIDAGFDEMRKLSMRLDTGLGVRWTVLRDPVDPLIYQHDPHAFYSISVALILNHQQYQPAAGIDHRTYLRLDVRVEAEQRLLPGLFIGNRFRLFSALDDTDVLLLRNEAYLRVAFGARHWLRLVYAFREDTNPAPGVRRVDHEFQLAFAARFD